MLKIPGWVMGGVIVFSSGHALAQNSASFPVEEPPAPAQPSARPAPAQPPSAPAPPLAAAPPPAPPVPAPGLASAPQPENTAAVEPSPNQPKPRYVSLTFSPLHLISPIVELQLEARAAPHFGVAIIGGFGSTTAQPTNPDYAQDRFSVWELGGQLVGYPLRDFSSLQLGAEVLYIHVSTNRFEGAAVEAAAGGVALGPFVGYKLLTAIGFTFFAQGGFEYVTARAEGTDSQGNTDHDEQQAFIPLLNLNVGWSF